MQRRQELVAALRARGLQLRGDSRLCDSYIATCSPALQHVVDTMHEMNWYFKHTAYEALREFEWEEAKEQVGWWRLDDVDKEPASHNAKVRALDALITQIGREGVLAMPSLPPTIRASLEKAAPPPPAN